MTLLIALLVITFGSLVHPFQTEKLPEKGVPLMRSFTPADYDHKGKIWDIDSAPNGITYMASDKGLLEYDGKTWNSYSGSDGITRSVVVVNDTLIYTGSDLDFGVWKRNKYNKFEYTSLYPFKEELNAINEEFWNIHVHSDKVLYISSNNVYVYKDDNLTKIPTPSDIKHSFHILGSTYFVDEMGGVFQLQDLSIKTLYYFEEYSNLTIVGMYDDEDENLIVVTQNAGLFKINDGQLVPINNSVSENLKKANVFSFERIGSSYLAFGTILNGVYITDSNGSLIHHINKNKGLQNSTILSLHYSKNGKLWLGMDYGVSYLDLNNKYTFIYDYEGTFGTAYSAILENGTFYLGTNQGLYTAQWTQLNNNNEVFEFDLVQGTEGQVWSLKLIEDQIWVSHDRGLFTINDGNLNKVSGLNGVWSIEQYKNYLLAGTYNGILIFKKNDSKWVYQRQMELIKGSTNQLLVDSSGVLWVNIPNFGVIRSKLDEELYPENREIFESDQFKGIEHYLENGNNGIHVVTDEYRYEYVKSQRSFREYSIDQFRNQIQDQLLRSASPSDLNNNYKFYPIYNGFALKQINHDDSVTSNKHEIVFRGITSFNNEVTKDVYNGAEVSHRLNNLHIEVIVPNEENVLYQFWTETTEEWSDWKAQNNFDIVGISYGTHTIRARAMVEGNITEEISFNYRVAPPWYLSWYALIVYVMLTAGLIYLLYLLLDRSLAKQRLHLLKNQKKTMREQHVRFEQQLKRVEQQKLKAENDNLKAELKNKTIELAAKAKESDEKNKVLKQLKAKLNKIEKNPASLKRNMAGIKQIVETNIGSGDNTFEIQIDELHQDFFDKLREEFPDLTRYDLRLCAYIRIGFDSKEISDLLNIKPSSVYISRSRLRKKLNIETDKDLHSYLNSI
jgi:DNA-binding CsgD family transcriptional regulator